MQISQVSAEGLKRQFKVVLPAGDLAQQVDTRLVDLARQVRMPGFRPGKAPVALIKKQYGRAVLGEVLQETVQQATQKTITDNGLKPALDPKIDVAKGFEDGGDFECTLDFEVLPDVVPGDLKSIQLEKLVADIPDAEVEKALERIAGEQRSFSKVERAAANGDLVVFDFAGTVDGVAFEGGTAENYELELGSGRFIPGFEDQLVGAQAGDAKDVKVTFPGDYGAKNLAGKDAVFACKVHEVRGAEKVPVDDELAKKLGLDDLKALGDAVRKQIEEEYGNFSRTKLKRNLFDKLNDMHSFDLPPTMVEMEFDSIWKQVSESPEQLQKELSELGKSEEQAKSDYRAIAERRVRLGLLLSEIGRLNNIEVKGEEVTRAMIEQARRFPGQERKVMEFYQKNSEAMARLRAPIYEDKVVNFVLDLAQVGERKVPVEDLVKAAEEDAA